MRIDLAPYLTLTGATSGGHWPGTAPYHTRADHSETNSPTSDKALVGGGSPTPEQHGYLRSARPEAKRCTISANAVSGSISIPAMNPVISSITKPCIAAHSSTPA
ncbi:Uncharacterised protein [Mycobacteroides abscessus subsp. massiliense]|nr:Uncharacterised protein [Mycobacteroides abscessus]SKL63141.1 Uncharacterised protein [Mycobacteroides abscessus subsp. massiliense]SLA42263.1 Uncharacterised protein [Mycobacteroides abscessus subsp. massiliense]SLD26657.1 Uncharacterised protein [Mycobacteroides abscessus subsp. massiliense]